jgi:hypothetical protein
MYARLAERVIAQAHPDEPARIESFRADVAQGLEVQDTKRSLLRSNDPAVRKAAYQELSAMPGKIIESAGKKLDERLGRRLFWQAVRVDLGQVGEEDAVAAVFANDPPQPADPNPADAPDAIAEAAGGADRLAFYGTALSARARRSSTRSSRRRRGGCSRPCRPRPSGSMTRVVRSTAGRLRPMRQRCGRRCARRCRRCGARPPRCSRATATRTRACSMQRCASPRSMPATR